MIWEENPLPEHILHRFHPDIDADDWHILHITYENDREIIKPIARFSGVQTIFENVDDGSHLLQMEFRDSQYELKTCIFRREDIFSKRGLPMQQSKGIDNSEFIFREVLKHHRNTEGCATVKRGYTGQGWAIENGKYVFRCHTCLGGNSEYIGPLALRQSGSLEAQIAWLGELVVGFPPTEMGIALGCAAPLLGYVGRYTPLEPFTVHIFGPSSTAKTTTLRAMTSLFGSPENVISDSDVACEGLLRTWNATENALLAPLRRNFGIVVVFDESGMLSADDVSRIIYKIASGRDKGRLDDQSDLRNALGWRTIVVSTGEHSLSSRMRRAGGAQVRLLELGNVVWSKSPEHANAIRDASQQVYGHVGPAFVRHLMEMNDAEVFERWRQWRAWCLAELDANDHFSARLADRYALILLAGEMAGDVLGKPLAVRDGIWPLLLQANRASADMRDNPRAAMEHLRETVNRFPDRFPLREASCSSHEVWGRIVQQDDGTYELYVFPKVLAQILRDGLFDDADVIKYAWRERGWIDCPPNGKFTRQRVVVSGHGAQQRVIVVKHWMLATDATREH